MTDREYLQLAAKAAGVELDFEHDLWNRPMLVASGVVSAVWNPITDDGDALRLAVMLRMSIDTDWNGGANAGNAEVGFFDDPEFAYQEGTGKCDPLAATRRAIVRAAAEIGKGTKPFPTAKEIREEWT